jgi:hypothetical protein
MRSDRLQSARRQLRARRAISMLAAAALAAAACTAIPTDGADLGEVLFLTESQPATFQMEALYKGAVVADAAGCLRLASESAHTVVWPHGFELRRRDGALAVIDPGGREIGRVGGSFTFGGGEVPTLHEGIALSGTQKAVALERCPGRYWIVGEVP